MTDFHRTALLLEEKAAGLPRDNLRRTHLLGLAQAARQAAVEHSAAERKRSTIQILIDHHDLSNDEAEFLYEIAARFGRRGFFLSEISDKQGGRRMVFRLRAKGVFFAAIGENDTRFGLDILYRWIVYKLEA